MIGLRLRQQAGFRQALQIVKTLFSVCVSPHLELCVVLTYAKVDREEDEGTRNSENSSISSTDDCKQSK